MTFTEDINLRYEAYGWHVQTIDDVNDLTALQLAIDSAKSMLTKPSLIKIRTIIGQGSSKEGTGGVHGAPLGKDDLAGVKSFYGFNADEFFHISPDIYKFYEACKVRGDQQAASWNDLFQSYEVRYPDLAQEYKRRLKRELPVMFDSLFPKYTESESKLLATRHRSEQILNALAGGMPEIVGGSADLTPSNLTNLSCSQDFQKETPHGRYIRYGVREHAMAAISNGIFAYGFYRPYCASFLQFIGYALGSVRVSALSGFGVIYIMTHDSIGLGEDGPTHQPIEMLSSLRSTPNLLTIRPADANETVGAYELAVKCVHTPTVLCLSRQNTPNVAGTSKDSVKLGAYVIADLLPSGCSSLKPDLIIVSTGTEVSLALETAKVLSDEDKIYIRHVHIWEIFI